MSMSKKKNRNRKKLKFILPGILVTAVLLAAAGIWQMKEYEKSVLEIYAQQQDAYVQLVLDQINLQPDRTDEEIIDNILGALDGSDQKYWTLSKDQTLMYVKDVTETNRYKGFTTPSFYSSDSASAFVKELTLNRVSHRIVQIDDADYVASGTVFGYNRAQYKVCLLTNEGFVLDNNRFLAVKISLYIYLGVLLVVLLLTAMILVYMLGSRDREIRRMREQIEQMYIEREGLEKEISLMNSFHTRWSLFEKNMLKQFILKLQERNVRPVTLVQLRFGDYTSRNNFLEQAQLLLDERVLRFAGDECGLYLVFIQYCPEDALKALNRLPDVTIANHAAWEDKQDITLMDVYERFMHETEEERTE